MAEALDELEQRVTRRYAELIADTIPGDIFNPDEWLTGDDWASMELPAAQQFPREQWVTYPNRRAVTLVIVDRTLDQWDALTQEQRWHIDILMAYGGRERIA